MPRKSLFLFIIILLTTLPALAQEPTPDNPTVLDTRYDALENDTITAASFYDWWRVEAAAGDVMVVDMQAADGLAPLLGLLNDQGDLVTRSEDGETNGAVRMEYTAPAAGVYTIVATRVGNADGTTTGSYALRIRRANAPDTTVDNPLQDVTFRCNDFEATTAASLQFIDDPRPDLKYRISVYGMDGFQPVIRVHFNVKNLDQPYEDCTTNSNAMLGDTFALPGEAPHTVTEDTLQNSAQLIISGADLADIVELTLGSRDGAPGRYLLVLDGMTIDPADDLDGMEVRIGPLAATRTFITAYMAAAPNSRLDPILRWNEAEQECDDAGRAACKGITTFAGAGVSLHESEGLTIIGDRSDAGLVLAPGNPDSMTLEFGSRQSDTSGAYAVFLIGELPARE
ncbi:MAG: hypothetical protein R3E39_10040 [Anaerolineae bacterium]